MSLNSETHYEVLGRRGTSWTIIGVHKKREPALAQAEKLWEKKAYKALRVIKESYDPQSQAFSSVDIFSRGKVVRPSKHDESQNLSPCLTPDDIYGPDGRRSIWRLLHNTLQEWAITPTELLHSLEHYNKLYNAGQKLQHAYQRIAVAFEDENESVQARMRKIERLVEGCVDTLKACQTKVPSLESGKLGPVAKIVDKAPNRHYLLFAAIAEYLRPALTISDKFGRVLQLMSLKREPWVAEALDRLLSEQLKHDRLPWRLFKEPEERIEFLLGLAQLAGSYIPKTPTLEVTAEPTAPESANGDAVTDQTATAPANGDQLIAANNTDTPDVEDTAKQEKAAPLTDPLPGLKLASPELDEIRNYFLVGQLPECQRVLAARLLNEIESTKPLTSKGFLQQIRSLDTLRTLISEVHFTADQSYNLTTTVEARTARLLSPQAISDLIHDIKDPFDKINFVLDLEILCHGTENKRAIANVILPIFQQPNYEAAFLGLGNKPMDQLPKLVSLQKRVLESGLTEMHMRKISGMLDGFAATIMENTDILKKLRTLKVSPQVKVRKLLTMMADGYFTEGSVRHEAEELAWHLLRSPGFIEDLMKQAMGDPHECLMEFKVLLDRAGLKRAVAAVSGESLDTASETSAPDANSDSAAEPQSSP